VAILVDQVKTPAPDVRSFDPARGVGAPLSELLARALSKDPGARPADARALGRAITEAARNSGISAGELLPSPTLLGAMSTGEPTRLLGSVTTHSGPAPVEPARESPSVPLAIPRERTASLRPFGIVLACFGLGVLGALGIATQVGGCGGAP
jgi:hypothetical protein